MIPEWKRGHFSLLFDGGFQPSLILLLDHEKKTWMDLHKEKKQAGKDPDSEVGTCAVCRLLPSGWAAWGVSCSGGDGRRHTAHAAELFQGWLTWLQVRSNPDSLPVQCLPGRGLHPLAPLPT